MISSARELYQLGFMGINNRNIQYLLRFNRRRDFPFVDDKLLTKVKLHQHGMPTPETYFSISCPSQIKQVDQASLPDQFVIKPARGAEGRGILVLAREGEALWSKPSGSHLSLKAIHFHLSNILSGMFSLGGVLDKAIIEYRVTTHPLLADITFRGVPDVRILLFLGKVVMAMLRIPTRESNGKANLHQGAVGVGVDLKTGVTKGGVHKNLLVDTHPDLHIPVAGIQVPYWDELLQIALRTHPIFNLGYYSVDFVIDAEQGPLILELNARPGLNIQLANRQGLSPMLRQIALERNLHTP